MQADHADRPFTDAEREAIREDLVAIVSKAIETPTYKDLSETVRLMQAQQRKVRQEAEGIARMLGRNRRNLRHRSAMGPALGIGLASGLTSGLLALAFMAPILSKRADQTEAPASDSLPAAQGIVDYVEADLPEYGGKIGLVFVGGEVLTAFKEEDRGVVVVNPLSEKP